jgi:zinc protease
VNWTFVPQPSLDLFVVSLVFPDGALGDPPGKEGLTALTAEMMLRGTRRWPRKSFQARLDRLGASLSIQVLRGHTQFKGECTSQHVPALVSLLTSVLSEPRFDAEELDRLVRQERYELSEDQDNDGQCARRLFTQALFHGHPFGVPVRGFPDSLSAVTLEDVTHRHRTLMASGPRWLGMVAPFPEARAMALAERVTSALPEGVDPCPVVPPLDSWAGLNIVLAERPGRTQAHVLLGQTGLTGSDPDLFPLGVAVTGFGGTFTSILVREIREIRGWSYDVECRHTAGRHAGVLQCHFTPENRNVIPAVTLTLQRMEQWRTEGLSSEHCEFARRFLTFRYPFLVDTTTKQLVERQFLGVAGMPPDFLLRFKENVGAVTDDDVRRCTRRVVRPAAQTLVVVGDSSLRKKLERLPGIQGMRVVRADDPGPLPPITGA